MALMACVLYAQDAHAQDGVCSFNWQPHYEQLTRLTDEFIASAGDGDSKTVPVWESTSGATNQLREIWYVPRTVGATCPAGTGTFHRTFNAGVNDFRDDPVPDGAAGYVSDALLGCPWTAPSRSGLKPLRRYLNSSISDHKTWLLDQTPSGYATSATWWTTGATPRLGYQRFGNLLSKASTLAAAYGINFLDNTILRVDYNHIWGNAVGKITHLATGKQIVLEPIGDMVQTVMRFSANDPDCRIPNPTQSGGAHCTIRLPGGGTQANLQYTERWAGSPVISTTKTVGDPQTLTAVVRPLDFCHNGQDQRTVVAWPGADSRSPLAWRGFFERSDTLSCKLGATTRRDVIKTTSRLMQAEGSTAGTQNGNFLNTHWLRADVLGDARIGQVTIEEVDLTTGQVMPISINYVANDSAGIFFYLNNGPGNGYVRTGDSTAHDYAIVVSKSDGSFGYAVARRALNAGQQLAVTLRCGSTCEPANVGVIIQAVDGAMAFNATAWSAPLDSYLVVNNRAAIMTRLSEIHADSGDCIN
jgi:hypothetical protein